ncbi:GIY-YIG nuclease family protein [Parabacteroides sp. FAFU027]|uniref:GIY-YIG nuclease family protein n=1 Tax=Parabacteroides sp. FAFU027 TaxID=2922715 RepID=UPI001FAFF4B7|nr:GIY-YIG nuclease family protein [Parabacteroides sp. FAFU027]
MPYFVYILQSTVDQSYYKGFTEDIAKRLEQHNNGESRYTSRKMPWQLVYLEELPSKREALIREKQIKRYNSIYLRELISKYKQNSDG